MLVDIGDFMLVINYGCWWQNFDIGDILWMLSDANVTFVMLKDRGYWRRKKPKLWQTSQGCRQHILSPTSVTNIDIVIVLVVEPEGVCRSVQKSEPILHQYNLQDLKMGFDLICPISPPERLQSNRNWTKIRALQGVFEFKMRLSFKLISCDGLYEHCKKMIVFIRIIYIISEKLSQFK